MDLAVSVVRTPMLPADTLSTARTAATLLRDTRVTHYYDAARQVGRALAPGLGWTDEVAWDIYLFYPAGSRWADGPPTPVAWMCQLREHADDVAHFRRGAALNAQLHATMQRLSGAG